MEVRNMKTLTLATLVAMGAATAAVAQQPGQPTPPPQTQTVPSPPGNDRTNRVSFEIADRNKDGLVNEEEGNLINGFDFSRADTNDDATLTRAEFQAAMAKSTPRGDALQSGDRTEQTTFDKADKNSDGKVSREEANEIDGFNFSKADVDANAYLSRQEFQTAMASSTPRG
jgi:Ca2+-binding EF-hand superfamily protein